MDFEWALARLARHDYRARARAIAKYALRGCEHALLGDALTPTQREHALTVYRSAVVLLHCASAVDATATRSAAEDLNFALNVRPVLRAIAEVQS